MYPFIKLQKSMEVLLFTHVIKVCVYYLINYQKADDKIFVCKFWKNF